MTYTEDEQGLRDLLSGSVADLDAPTQRLAAGAVADGRRLRRRRRVAVALASVAVVAVTGAAVPRVLDREGGAEAGFADGPSAGVDPTVEPVVPAAEPGWWSRPAGEMADLLADRLPEGTRMTNTVTTNTDRAPGEQLHELQGYLIATLEPATGGAGKINLILVPPPAEQGELQRQLSCDPDVVERPEDCRELHDASGALVGQVVDSTVDGVRSLGVSLRTDDGGLVLAYVANTLDAKWPDGASPSADRLPLGPARLRALAADPVWTAYRP